MTDVGVSVGGGTFALTVQEAADSPLSGIKCHVFNASDVYLGLSATTDENGQVAFDLADGTYRFRADYLGSTFWSDPTVVSGSGSAAMTIAQATVPVDVLSAGSLVAGAKVYLFSLSDSYLGMVETTNDSGRVTFHLPMDSGFRFRADVLGKSIWSGDITVAENLDPVLINAGGGHLAITVGTDGGTPLVGLKAYLFDTDGRYLNLSRQTDADGQVAFDVPAGSYKVRADYLGYSFWTGDLAVTSDAEASLVVAFSPITVSVMGHYQTADTPLSGIPSICSARPGPISTSMPKPMPTGRSSSVCRNGLTSSGPIIPAANTGPIRSPERIPQSASPWPMRR